MGRHWPHTVLHWVGISIHFCVLALCLESVVSVLTGPVRGIDFHSNQPLFVSGGDDYKIKVSGNSARSV